MKPSEYLDKCKITLQIKSDYALAKALKTTTPRISDYYKSKAWPDAYACAQIALALKLDPLEVLADIESQSAKTEERREFWRGFIGRTKKVAAVLLLALTFISISQGGGSGANWAAMVAASGLLWVLVVRIMYIM
ncbi:hypothetical protein SCT_1183 [Sulfuricella sp. T08]|uniref:hypothetical protein n=1 Tax=Sulfuricella sp. T08 TaxID=1632857 RepID=UPI000617A131|nr:hypothetical protein [Sulfuricella sp. T08]GAO35791.1 hypothetical protein SCT_1183 [Sulfuricella sp. T08]